ncbi:EAL domain-containing protein [Ruminococcus flavefaciens]|uniref:DNA-binding transcriptional regulator, LacI/PurR family n=1 Tax=Ruminococcus flavefaciens TaxID=1265 RepID=A0A1M7LLS9_RUMFL|nr:EAL domain-containing protein [Ruminococcus flavefaciens]SHM79139.1 DNA-binding transcriptional regulator, LacI/PurR family [Ruminococcus flavefaciens]
MNNTRKKLALFVGQADEEYQSRFISGFLKKALAADYDVCIFSMYLKYQDTQERELGESNIFSLMNPSKFDGVIILKDSIQSEGAAETLENRLKETFDRPIVVIEKESDLFPSICTDGYSAVSELIDHLITTHGCRDISFVSGKKWHKHSKERLKAYRDAMKSAGLEVSEDRIFYGDFWYQSGEIYAEKLLAENAPLPDAVACANDQMAIGLCKVFSAHGIRVPEDIAVVGYDSTYEGRTSPCSLTSSVIPAYEFGEYAFDFLMKKMQDKTPDSFKLKPQMLIGESCGCHNETMPQYQIRRSEWGTDISEEGFDSIFNNMDENLITQSSLIEYISTVYSYAYQLKGISEFHLCIESKWRNIGLGVRVPHNGYRDMIHAIRYYSSHKNNMAGLEETFSAKEMLPDLYNERPSPAAYFFTPVYFENECFGYAAVRCTEPCNSYNDIYRRWITAVCRGFEILKRNVALKHMQEQLERMRNNKFAVYSYAYGSLDEKEKKEYDLVSDILNENLLDYYFQPIVNTIDGRIYGYEALMRSKTNPYVSPLSIIKFATMQERLEDVERATFINVLRIINEKRDLLKNVKVFINSIPGIRINKDDLPLIKDYLDRNSAEIVIELTEEAELSDNDLTRLQDFYNEYNIGFAVDDYGTGYSNVTNLLRYMPDYVKIDRSLISEIQNQPKKQHFVSEIIDFCHDNNILALAEGVETSEELRTVIHLGADLIQGYYTARPSAEIIPHIDEKLMNEIRQFHQERIDGNNKKIYSAGKTNRISLTKLVKNGYTDIVVGKDEMVYKDVSIIGTPEMKTNIHLRVEAGYSGRITLEDVFFTNIKKRPCIEIGADSNVAIVLRGTNRLMNTGIQVHESSRLIMEGDGTLTIDLNAAEYYGIGNKLDARHGELIFDQDGAININCRGQKGVCIGSGLGGKISINRGEYNLISCTESCVGIGAVTGEARLNIKMCLIEAEFTGETGLLIGSLENNAFVSISKVTIHHYGKSTYMCIIGSINGNKAAVTAGSFGSMINIMSDNSTIFGALNGISEIDLSDSSLKLESTGKNALIFGGFNDNTSIKLFNSDINAVVRSAEEKDTYADDENIHIVNGRLKILVNDKEIKHNIVFNYT